MKKEYINPELETIEITTVGMLAVSDPPVGGSTNDPNDLLAPSYDFEE